MQPEPLDLVGVLVALLTFIVSRDVAATVGPYAAIAILACAGAALSLSGAEANMESRWNWKSLWFVSIRVLLAVSVTISIAEVLEHIVPWLKPRYSLSPIAFGIGWIRDYDQVRDWFGRMIDRLTSKRIDDGK